MAIGRAHTIHAQARLARGSFVPGVLAKIALSQEEGMNTASIKLMPNYSNNIFQKKGNLFRSRLQLKPFCPLVDNI